MDQKYSIRVSVVGNEGAETVLEATGDVRVLGYLHNVGLEALKREDVTQASVSVAVLESPDGAPGALNYTGDADDAHTLLRSKVEKIRRWAKAARTNGEALEPTDTE
jgi:hypothetical protein